MLRKVFLFMVALAIIGASSLNLQYSLKKESVQTSINIKLKGSETLAQGEQPNWVAGYRMVEKECFLRYEYIGYTLYIIYEYRYVCVPYNSDTACDWNFNNFCISIN